MKHEHDGWLYYLPNGDLTFQTFESYRRRGHCVAATDYVRMDRIIGDDAYIKALENVTNTTPTQRDTLGKENAT